MLKQTVKECLDRIEAALAVAGRGDCSSEEFKTMQAADSAIRCLRIAFFRDKLGSQDMPGTENEIKRLLWEGKSRKS